MQPLRQPQAEVGGPWYPLRCAEIIVDKPWGGDGLRKLLGKSVGDRAGECWEIVDLPGLTSKVANGPWSGQDLREVIRRHPREILGEDVWIRHTFLPLVIKFLWCEDRLSLQVHPGDEFARSIDAQKQGKMEAWYVVHATPDARIIRGVLPGTTPSEFRDLLQSGRVEDCLNRLRVKQSDVIFIPPGTIHCAYGGVLLYEVQQASDLTLRFTDWGRIDGAGPPRPIEWEKALRAMDIQSVGVSKLKPIPLAGFGYHRKLLIRCEKFSLDSIHLAAGTKAKVAADPNRFQLMTVLEGKGKFLTGPKKERSEPFQRVQTFLMPAFLGEFEIRAERETEILVAMV